MTVEEIAAKVIEVIKMDGCFDALPMALVDCEERGACRETIITALGLAVVLLRDDAKASLHQAETDPMHADHHLRADERTVTLGMLDEQVVDGEYE